MEHAVTWPHCLWILIGLAREHLYTVEMIHRKMIHRKLTNRPQFSMVYTLINHRNDVIKCLKLKWNHQQQASGFTAKFWTFYDVISMVYKSVHHGKLWSNFFFTITFIFRKLKTTGTAWHVTSFHGLKSHRPSSRPISARGFAQLS